MLGSAIEVLRAEHRNIIQLLQALEHQIDVFAQDGAPDYDVIDGVADYFLDYPDRCHHPKEDLVFARLHESHPEHAATIGDLAREHRDIHECAQRFRHTVSLLLNETDIARSAVVDAARVFIEAERRHVRMEEERFFPLAERLLTPETWLKIEGELTKRSDPLFGGKVEEGFRKLSQQLLAWEREQAQ
jgi:hemerythrin-like domain-containing protein